MLQWGLLLTNFSFDITFLPQFLFSLIIFSFLERVKGIEPLHPAWKASVLPLNYTRNIQTYHALNIVKSLSLVEGERFELSKTEVNGFTARPI